MKIGIHQNGSKIEYLNLLAKDTATIEFLWLFAAYLFVGPLKTCLIILILIKNGDRLMLSGLVPFLLVVPIQFGLGRLFGILK